MELEKHKREQERKKLQEEIRRKEEEDQRSRLEGRLEKFIDDLQKNNSANEGSLAGLELGPIRSRILARTLESNTTLKELHLNRKGITDEAGAELIRALMKN